MLSQQQQQQHHCPLCSITTATATATATASNHPTNNLRLPQRTPTGWTQQNNWLFNDSPSCKFQGITTFCQGDNDNVYVKILELSQNDPIVIDAFAQLGTSLEQSFIGECHRRQFVGRVHERRSVSKVEHIGRWFGSIEGTPSSGVCESGDEVWVFGHEWE